MEMTERGGFSKPEDRTMKFTQPEQQRGTRLKKKILRINGIKKKIHHQGSGRIGEKEGSRKHMRRNNA